jgi:hypothetical protein
VNDSEQRRTPYQGLEFFSEADEHYFFGRDRERDLIIANLKGRRLTLLYAASGVGKSSLLRAGVAAQLLRLAHRDEEVFGSPEFLPVVVSNWRDDPETTLVAAIEQAVGAFTPFTAPRSGLVEVIAAAAERANTSLLIIFDQFEEFCLYHSDEGWDQGFAAEFVRAMKAESLRAAFLVSIREDALAQLDFFKGRIPTLFESILRISPLGTEAGRRAIEDPIARFNLQRPETEQISIEPQLVDAVLDQVGAGKVTLEKVARGTIENAPPDSDAIEAPFLQLVLSRLWDDERKSGSRVLRLSTLESLGGAQQIVRTHLDLTLGHLTERERQTAADVFNFLVTPSGSKIVHTVPDLANYTGRSVQTVGALLQKLEHGDTRIVRPIPPREGGDGQPRYEIFHDVLAAAILDWRRRYVERRTRHVRRRAAVAIGLAVCVLGGSIGFVISRVTAPSQLQRLSALIPANHRRACTAQGSENFWVSKESAELDCNINDGLSIDYALFTSPANLDQGYGDLVKNWTFSDAEACSATATWIPGCERGYSSSDGNSDGGRLMEFVTNNEEQGGSSDQPELAFTVPNDLVMVVANGEAVAVDTKLTSSGDTLTRYFDHTVMVNNAGLPDIGTRISVSPVDTLFTRIPAGLDRGCLVQNPSNFYVEYREDAEIDCSGIAGVTDLSYGGFASNAALLHGYQTLVDSVAGTTTGAKPCLETAFVSGCESAYPGGRIVEYRAEDGSGTDPVVALRLDSDKLIVFAQGPKGDPGGDVVRFVEGRSLVTGTAG